MFTDTIRMFGSKKIIYTFYWTHVSKFVNIGILDIFFQTLNLDLDIFGICHPYPLQTGCIEIKAHNHQPLVMWQVGAIPVELAKHTLLVWWFFPYKAVPSYKLVYEPHEL